MKITPAVVVLLFFTTSLSSLLAQGVQRNPKFYDWFDDQVKRYNTGLFNGIEYIELYRTINERHKFFESSEFQNGSIVYDGQFYNQVPLKYDLDSDELLFNVGYNYPYPTLILFKDKVSSFQLGGSDFIRIDIPAGEVPLSGFYENLLTKEPLTLFKKNKKKRFKRIKGSTVYYEFDDDNSYFIKYRNQFYAMDKKKDIISIWPDKKDFINEYFNPALRKSDEDNFWVSFFTKLADSYNATTEIENR